MPEEQTEQGEDNLTQAQRRDWSKNMFNFANLLIIAIAIGLLIFLVRIRGILGIFLAATVLSVLLTPPVQFFERRRVPKIAAILLVYIVIFGILITSVTLLVPVAIQQGLDIADAYPEYRAKLLQVWDEFRTKLDVFGMSDEVTDIFNYSTPERQQAIASALQRAVSQGWEIILSSASVITTLVSIPVIAFYLLKDGPIIRQTLMGLLPESWHNSTSGLLGALSGSVYGYVKGQLLLCLVMFLITWPILTILGVPYALLLAVLAGLMEFIPIIGPTIALIPAFLIAVFFDFDPASAKGLIVSLSPIWRGGVVILTYIGIQLSESNLLVPRIMGHTMDIHPLAVIFALLCGAVFAGIWGMLLALPVAAAVKVMYQYFYPSFIERIDKLLSFE